MMADACGMPGLAMMPTTLMSGIQEELLIAFRAQHGRRNDLRSESRAGDGLFHALAGLMV